MSRTVAIVPHTHWDREWYLPFQTFRMRLVRLLDQLLPMLEADASYAHFLLDGQTAIIDDYLEIRPAAAATIQRLAAAGRLAVGPWMILMDEFMVSGETIVRDLQLGRAAASRLGGASEVGYLPDMFGHIAQMPQVLRLAGLNDAVVWRGVPAAVEQTAFRWVAPDGSSVRAEFLVGSYSNGRDMPRDAASLVARARDYDTELGPARLGDLLFMNGTDHQLPQPWLGRVVAEANAAQDEYHFTVTSLADYLAKQPSDGLFSWEGELRSGSRSNLLMGVASNRVDVHRLCAAAERSIERRAEPLHALLVPPEEYPSALIDLAWRQLVLNSAHDSSCACSADEVVEQVRVRYAEARQIGDGLTRDALHTLASAVDTPPGSTIVVNPTARDRGGLVEATVPGSGPLHFVAADGTPRPAQIISQHGDEAWSATVTGGDVSWVLDMARGTEFAGRQIASFSPGVRPGDSRTENETDAPQDAAREVTVNEVTVQEAAPGETPVDVGPLREHLVDLASRGEAVRVRLLLAPVRTAVFDVGEVPGFGWATFRAADGDGPPGTVVATGSGLGNEHLRVAVDTSDGTFAVSTNDGLEIAGLGRLVDGGDGGDTYNYSPPAEDRVVEQADSVTISIVETGPVRARLLVESMYTWPAHAVGDERLCTHRSAATESVRVRTTLELRSGERFLRVRSEIDNRCRDHRLRAHFPLPARVAGSDAECAFAVVHRGLSVEGGPHEAPLPTFPSRRFVDASDGRNGLALLHDGLLEYEVVGGGTELALTLLRATGYLSRSELALRPNPAGPIGPLEGPQLQGRHVVEYAVLPHRGDWREADLYARADELLIPLERVRGGGVAGATRPAVGRPLRVDGAEVSAVLRDEGRLIVRVFRTDPAPGRVRIELDGAPAPGAVVDLCGGVIESFSGELVLRPWQIATLRLD